MWPFNIAHKLSLLLGVLWDLPVALSRWIYDVFITSRVKLQLLFRLADSYYQSLEREQLLSHHLLLMTYAFIQFWFGLRLLIQGMLNEESDKFPIFHNMRTLDLDSCFHDDYELYKKLEALGSFLCGAPCLEKLILKCCMVRACLILCIASCFRWFA